LSLEIITCCPIRLDPIGDFSEGVLFRSLQPVVRWVMHSCAAVHHVDTVGVPCGLGQVFVGVVDQGAVNQHLVGARSVISLGLRS